MEQQTIRISGIVEESVVDGPGIRYVIFTQGCKHNCKGCHNPSTHSLDGGKVVDALTIIDEINTTNYLQGVTFSGGEPFLQAKECAYIASKIKKEYSIMVYTGFLFENLLKMSEENPNILEFLKQVDILVDGPFVLDLKSYDLKFKGSSNHRIIDVKQSLSTNSIVLFLE